MLTGKVANQGLIAALLVLLPLTLSSTQFTAGDVAPYGNPDGQLNVGDALVLQRFLNGELTPTPEEQLLCDVAPLGGADGFLNAGDLAVLYRAILGEITLPPVNIAPAAPVLYASSSPTNESAYLISGTTEPDSSIRVYVNGVLQRTDAAEGTGGFLSYADLQAGINTIYVTAFDGVDESAPSNTLDVEFVALPPVADPGGPYVQPRGESMKFDGRNSWDRYGRFLTYSWDFGDGGSGAGATPTHTYTANGTYTVTLTVTAGGQDSVPVTTTVVVKDRLYMVPGVHPANTTLTNDTIYIFANTFTVQQADTLVIEAGTELRFDYSAGLDVYGSLQVQGIDAEPVRFARTNTFGSDAGSGNNWGGITLYETSHDVSIDHAIIEGATDGITIFYNGGETAITNSVIQDNSWTGIQIYSDASFFNPVSPLISGNVIQDTDEIPYDQVGIYVDGDARPLIIDGNIIRYNDTGVGLSNNTAGEGNPQPVFNGNAIYRNYFNYYAYYPYPLQSLVLDARDNWWGTIDTVLINRDNYDRRDDDRFVTIDYSNYRSVPLDHDLVLDPVYAETSDRPYIVRGTAQPGAEVNIYADGSRIFLLGAATADADGRFALPVEFPEEGGYALFARRLENGQEVETSLYTFGFYYTPDPWWTDTPVIDPVPATVTYNPYIISIDTGQEYREANIYVNGILQGVSINNNYDVYFPVTLNAGTNTIEAAYITDAGEGPRSTPVTVEYVPDATVTGFSGGTISPYQTVVLPAQATPYQISSDILVSANARLIIQAGAELEFDPDTRLTAQGELAIQGTAANPVRLYSAASSPAASDWVGVVVPLDADQNTRIEHALIEHASLGVWFNAGTATLTHSELRNNYYGVYVAFGADPVIAYNTIETNVVGVRLSGGCSPVIYPHNTITGNDEGISIIGTGLPGGNPTPEIRENNLFGNTDFDLGLSDFYDPGNVSFEALGNWWGTTDTALIDSHILDGKTPATNAPLVTYLPVQPALLTDNSPLTPELDVLSGITNQLAYTVTGTAEPNREVRIYQNGALNGSVNSDAAGQFSFPLTLQEGVNTFYGVAVNGAETSLPYLSWSRVLDTVPPVLTVTTPAEGVLVNHSVFLGYVDEPGTLTLPGATVTLDQDLNFVAPASGLVQGPNTVQVVATDLAGNSTTLDRSFTLDSVPPVIPDPAQITVGVPSGGSVAVSAVAGTATAGDTVTLTNTRTGESVQTTVAGDGSYAGQLGAQAGDTLVILLTDPAGNATATRLLQVAGTPPALGFTVTTPLDGSSVDEDHVAVAGTYQGTANIGITVNGTTAELIGATFCAGDIGLATGVNSIEISATQPDGSTTSQTLTVTSTGPGLVTLVADAERGFAPHTVTFGITDNTQATITLIEYDFDGDGSVDDTRTDPAVTVQHTYTTPGCYTARVTVTDDQAVTYVATRTIAVTEADLQAGGVLGVYYGMLENLRNGDIPGAMDYVTETMRDQYESGFNVLTPAELAAYVDTIGAVAGGSFADGVAEIMVIREEDGMLKAFPVYVIREPDGIWRVGGM